MRSADNYKMRINKAEENYQHGIFSTAILKSNPLVHFMLLVSAYKKHPLHKTNVLYAHTCAVFTHTSGTGVVVEVKRTQHYNYWTFCWLSD